MSTMQSENMQAERERERDFRHSTTQQTAIACAILMNISISTGTNRALGFLTNAMTKLSIRKLSNKEVCLTQYNRNPRFKDV